MDKHILIYLYNEVLLRNKNKLCYDTHNKVGISQKNHDEQKKPDTKVYKLKDFTYMKAKNRQNKCRVIEIREWLHLGWGKLNRTHMREFPGLIEIFCITLL